MNISQKFKTLPKKYRPIPFWSWNEKLNTNETERQINVMHNAGMGGFFMHARGGLQTEYMDDEWFDNVNASIKCAKKLGMDAWAYDENGWPSGFGNGFVNGKGIEYQQKYLRMENEPVHTDTAICKCGDYWFYYEVNPFYVDTLDKNVIKEFINSTYEVYYKKFKNDITGFFTDEPQVSRNGIPWSFVFESEYKDRYGDNILEHLDKLFVEKGDYKETRIKFWKMVTDLFSDAYSKQIYDWCQSKGLKFTGHLACEDHLLYQLMSNGECMPNYEYFHIPGMDWLCRDLNKTLTARQLSSACEQLGKKQVLTESFALCGHNVSLAELKGIYENQVVRGINMLCTHLEGYSIRGIRKRDYPPAMYMQQPWWIDFDKWVDAMSRLGMVMAESKKSADVLLLHPMTTAWTLYNSINDDNVCKLNDEFLSYITKLENKHIMFHLGDETIMERHARVENGVLIIGEQKYSKVIPGCASELLPNTKKLLSEFEKSGGIICTVDDIEPNNVCDNENILYYKANYECTPVHYFVNSSADEFCASININGEYMDLYTGDMYSFSGEHTFEPWGSLLLFENGAQNLNSDADNKPVPAELKGTFRLEKPPLNALTLDYCDYYFDGKKMGENVYILNVCEQANELERNVNIKLDFSFEANYIPDNLKLVIETPQIFDIYINNNKVNEKPTGYYVDKSFNTINIKKYAKIGKNTVTLVCNFVQSEKFYQSLKKSKIFESEKNKLCYDMELESIYIIGDFSLNCDGVWQSLDKNAVRYNGSFVIDKPKSVLTLYDIEKQGYPFFCGEMELTGEVDIPCDNAYLSLNMNGINSVRVQIDNIDKTILTNNKLKLNGVKAGKHNIRLTLKNNLRNLLGPHHLGMGESFCVGPADFYQKECVWRPSDNTDWNDGYCFVKTGLY